MSNDQKLKLWDEQGFDIIEALPAKYLKRKMKQYRILVKTEPFPNQLAIELVNYYLAL